MRALEEGDPEAAQKLFEDPEWSAVAGYEAGDFSDSAAGFAGGWLEERGDEP